MCNMRNVFICPHVCMCICVYVYVCLYVCVFAHVYVHAWIWVQAIIYVHLFLSCVRGYTRWYFGTGWHTMRNLNILDLLDALCSLVWPVPQHTNTHILCADSSTHENCTAKHSCFFIPAICLFMGGATNKKKRRKEKTLESINLLSWDNQPSSETD